jgi:hypothetical protein
MRVLIVVLSAMLLAACGGSDDDMDMPDTTSGSTAIGGAAGGHMVMGVNAYLWHATLDTLSFMPLKSADPYGGIILTDWYSDPSDPNERMRVSVYILDRRLRADGIKVTAFRQTHTAADWVDAQVNPDTANKIEDAILTRARELRLATVKSGD